MVAPDLRALRALWEKVKANMAEAFVPGHADPCWGPVKNEEDECEPECALLRAAPALLAAAEDAERYRAALVEAREMVESWAAYADDYFKEKHDLAGDLAKLDAALTDRSEG